MAGDGRTDQLREQPPPAGCPQRPGLLGLGRDRAMTGKTTGATGVTTGKTVAAAGLGYSGTGS